MTSLVNDALRPARARPVAGPWKVGLVCCLTLSAACRTSNAQSCQACDVTNAATGSYSTIGGGRYNTATGQTSTVRGSYGNVSHGNSTVPVFSCSTVGGGFFNTASGFSSTVGGGETNVACATYSTISGGVYNAASGGYSTIGGGSSSDASATYSTVGGGESNAANGGWSTIAGGSFNTAIGGWSTVGGGTGNTARADSSMVGGGAFNIASELYSTVSGGFSDRASGGYSTVGGGNVNTASGEYSTVGGGEANTASATFSTIGGGRFNMASGQDSTVLGSYGQVSHDNSAVLAFRAGADRCPSMGDGTVNMCVDGGFFVNGALVVGVNGTAIYQQPANGNAVNGTAVHQQPDAAGSAVAEVALDASNSVTGTMAVVGGGLYNSALGNFSSVAGGFGNVVAVQATHATVAGGCNNTASGYNAFVGGGGARTSDGTGGNVASGDWSAVCGGYDNTASGIYSTVSGGRYSTAAGQDSSVLGAFAHATHDSSAVLAFSTGSDVCDSMGDGTVNVCVDNGFFVNGELMAGTAVQQQLDEAVVLNATVAAMQTTIESHEETLASQQATLASQQATLASQQASLASQQATIVSLNTTVTSQQAQISELYIMIADALLATNSPAASFVSSTASATTPCDVDNGSLDCAADCVGSWSPWSACPVTCGQAVATRGFDVATEARNGGAACLVSGSASETAICTAEVACMTTAAPMTVGGEGSTSEVSTTVLVVAVIGAAVVAGVVVAVAVLCVLRQKRTHKHLVLPASGGETSGAIGHKAVHIAVEAEAGDGDAADIGGADFNYQRRVRRSRLIVQQMRSHLQADPQGWQSLEALVGLVHKLDRTKGGHALDAAGQSALTEAIRALRAAVGEFQQQMDTAVATKDFDRAKFYSRRVDFLESALPIDGDQDNFSDGDADLDATTPRMRVRTPAASSLFECVAHGLLLRRDRFDGGGSPAFLGRGASSAVSRGILTEVVGSLREQRTAVAVKEVPKTGVASEQRAIRELVIVRDKLGPHPNVVQILTVKASGAMFYVIMELCHFSLDAQPHAFAELLHAPDSGVAALVLNALVQDLVRGVAFLHAKRVFHCDLKPANVLVAFNRGGKKRHDFKPKYFKQAQLKLADFGVSRVVTQAVRDSGAEGSGGPAGVATTTTATVSMEGLQAAQGIAGTQAYICGELLQILHDLKQGRLATEPEVGDALLAANDAFGCGCVIAFLCSRGRHPFQHAVFRSVPDNILAHRRVSPRKLGIADARHVELVDRFTAKAPADRWTVAHAQRHSSVFGLHDGIGTDTEILLDMIELHQKPKGSCSDQLAAPWLADACPLMPEMVEQMELKLESLLANEQALPTKLDAESCVET